MSKKSTDSGPNGGYNPYLVDKLAKIPAWVKCGFMKFWFAGAAFYFCVFGLPATFDYLDKMVFIVLVMTLGVEYLVIPVIRWMKTDDIDTTKHLPHEVRRRSILSLLATGLYVLVIVFMIDRTLALWSGLGLPTIGDLISESPADPFSFGFLFLLFDFIWMQIRSVGKNLGRRKKDV